jgi:hypothetical protein
VQISWLQWSACCVLFGPAVLVRQGKALLLVSMAVWLARCLLRTAWKHTPVGPTVHKNYNKLALRFALPPQAAQDLAGGHPKAEQVSAGPAETTWWTWTQLAVCTMIA